jgi:transposase-like protein
MEKRKLSERQIILTLKECEQGLKISDICREHGISDTIFYNWKAKYRGVITTEVLAIPVLRVIRVFERLKEVRVTSNIRAIRIRNLSVGDLIID